MRIYRAPAPEVQGGRFWRLTCFVVDRKYRRGGIAGVALQAALESIERQGGGVVEAYPVVNWEGKSFGNMSTHGTASMFKKAGFKRVAPFGNTNVVMRKTI
jgi:GNAT superfamily N-acetyltransferase